MWVLLVTVIVAYAKKINIAIQIIKEASRAIMHVPAVLLVPIATFSAMVCVLLFGAAQMALAARPVNSPVNSM